MEIKTFRAKSMHEALSVVRQELGINAAVLHTREVRARRLFGLISGPPEIEVTASVDVHVPSRLPEPPSSRDLDPEAGRARPATPEFPPRRTPIAPTPPEQRRVSVSTPGQGGPVVPADSSPSEPTTIDWRRYGAPATESPSAATPAAPGAADRPQSSSPDFNREVQDQLNHLHTMLEDLYRRSRTGPAETLPDSLFHVFTELIEADVSEEVARGLIEEVRQQASGGELADPVLIKTHIARRIESRIPVGGPIRLEPGQRRVVALVGPTGVGKTTTIAKLAAHYRLREKRSVGFITVDTYRIAAVEQLRTYAEIIDLPMEVVSTPSEMREAVGRMQGLDLILVDTAGRSPRDEIRIQELKALLSEAETDEVHLVLSAASGARALRQTAERFAVVGADSLIVTKLDEASALGHLFPLLRDSSLPLRYWTTGQNVPDDIETATASRAARLIMAAETLDRRS